MKLLPFELKKMIYNKKFLYLCLLLVGLVIIVFSRNWVFESYIDKEARQRVDDLIRASQSNGRMLIHSLEKDPENEELKTLQSINYDIIDILYELRNNVTSDDWRTRLQMENEFLPYILEYKNAGGDHPLSHTEIAQTIAHNKKLLDENIKPEHPTYSLAFPNFLKIMTDLFINFGAILLLILFIGDLFSSEFENRSIGLLFTQPLNKQSVITSKFFGSVIIYLIITIVVFSTSTILGLLLGKEGTFHYPLLIEKNNEFYFITIADYLIQGLTITSVFVLLVISLIMIMGLLLKNTMTALFVLLVTILGGFSLTFLPWNFFNWINPFQYLLAEDIILYQNESVWYQAIPVSLTLTIVLILLSRTRIKSAKFD